MDHTSNVADDIEQLEAQLRATRNAILKLLESGNSSQSISGGGAVRSKTKVSLEELRAYESELRLELRKLRRRTAVHVGFNRVGGRANFF